MTRRDTVLGFFARPFWGLRSPFWVLGLRWSLYVLDPSIVRSAFSNLRTAAGTIPAWRNN
jgi:hypothetical protein